MLSRMIQNAMLWLITSSVLAATPANTLVMARSIDDLITLDPAVIFEINGLEYANNVYEPLVKNDPQTPGKFIGGLATHWDISEDGLRYTFYINPKATFHSGNPVTAYDAAYSLQRILHINKGPADMFKQFGWSIQNIGQTIQAIAPNQLQLVTTRPYAPSLLFNCLASPSAGIVDAKLVKTHSQKNDWGSAWLSQHSAGSGLYQLKSWHPSQMLVLTRRAHPWQSIPAQLAHILIRHVPEVATQQLLLEKGDVDITRNLKPSMLDSLDNVQVIAAQESSLLYLALNQSHPQLKIPEVQEALKWLINYDDLITLAGGSGTQHQSIIPKGTFASIDECPYHLNVNKAKALLKSVGLAAGFTVTIDTNRREFSELLKSNFAKANIDLKILIAESKQILSKFRNREHDIFLGLWMSDFQDPQSNASTFAYNPDNSNQGPEKTLAWRNHWFNPDINHLSQQALYEANPTQRQHLYAQLQQTILKSSPFIILMQRQIFAIANHNVHHFALNNSPGATNYGVITKD